MVWGLSIRHLKSVQLPTSTNTPKEIALDSRVVDEATNFDRARAVCQTICCGTCSQKKMQSGHLLICLSADQFRLGTLIRSPPHDSASSGRNCSIGCKIITNSSVHKIF